MSSYCQLCGREISAAGKRRSSREPGTGQGIAAASGRGGGEPADEGQVFHHPLWPPDVVMEVCSDCGLNRPRCRNCGLPLAVFPPNGFGISSGAPFEAQSLGFCATCSRSLNACLSCGRPVKGKYYSFDGAGPYCAVCYRSRPPCDVCGAPLTYEYWQLSDGRVTCSGCHATAIYSPEAAADLYRDLKDVIAALLGLRLNIPTGLALVDRNQLRQVIAKQRSATPPGRIERLQPPSATAASGLEPLQSATGKLADNSNPFDAENTLGLYARRGIRRGIYIQTGLPRLLFLQIAAHEYAHAWQGENCPMLRDSLVHEGFAEWVAYRSIGHYGFTRGQERMLNRRDVYGDGLRWALDVETRLGVQGLVETCRRTQGEA